LPAWLVSKLRNIPYGVFTFGMDLLYPQTTVYKGLFNYLLKKADIVFADSSAAAQILPGLGVNPAQVVVVYPSVNITGRVPDADLLEALRERHGLAGKKCILTVGRLVERKGHDTVLRAMPQILESVPEAHYLIVGQGVHEPTLRALVQELQLTSHVTFAGYAAEEELSTYYALGDVFVMISREIPEKGDIEGFGMVYLEANLLGKPVVAGRSGGVPEAVLHEQTGLLVMPTDVQEVSEAITRLLNAPELAERLGNFGRRRTIMDFSSRANADRVFKILRTIAAE
jgi:phosphatidylinositol alpha-1,6-mannosyltransferase